jgi:hypothetical protein
MPEDLDLIGGYTLRVTALDATDGSLVTGVNVETVVITAVPLGPGPPEALAYGPFMLVPGPGA